VGGVHRRDIYVSFREGACLFLPSTHPDLHLVDRNQIDLTGKAGVLSHRQRGTNIAPSKKMLLGKPNPGKLKMEPENHPIENGN